MKKEIERRKRQMEKMKRTRVRERKCDVDLHCSRTGALIWAGLPYWEIIDEWTQGANGWYHKPLCGQVVEKGGWKYEKVF